MRSFALAAVGIGLAFGWGSLHYPSAPQGHVVDVYHGVRVPDPYRWLENTDSPETQKWIREEDALTASYFANFPGEVALKKRLLELTSATVYPSSDGAGIMVRGGRYFFVRRESDQNQPVLYWMPSRDAEPRVLLDPNTMSKEGIAALDSWSVTLDGKKLVYGLARAGSDWQDVFFRDVDTGADLPDKLEWIKFVSPAWSADGAGVYYGRFPKPLSDDALLQAANTNEQLCFHRLGQPQSSDKVVYERPDHKDWMFMPRVTEDGRYVILGIVQGTAPENLIYYRREGSDAPFTCLIGEFQAHYGFVTNNGPTFYFETTSDAPRGRLISIDTSAGNRRKEIVPQATGTLQQAGRSGDDLYLVYEQDVTSVVRRYSMSGKAEGEIPLPGKGDVHWTREAVPPGEQFFSFESFTEPSTLYTWRSGQNSSPFRPVRLPFDPEKFETRQVFYTSKDGSRIPMFLVGRKGFRADPQTPCLLWAYGGFDISVNPSYHSLFLEWVEMGGIFASANLRGGSEYGEEWHKAGMGLNKQNVFDDFAAAAEWLITNHYTSTPKLGIYGRSNGGLLIGASLNQHPHLYGAEIAGVGVMDMLRFPNFTIGNAWTTEYGRPDNAQDFKTLLAYSPLHNIKPGVSYPPTLILTSDHDDRVVPAHSFKYAAALQHAQAGEAPILIRIETSAGHGGGKPVSKQVEESTAIIEFLEKNLKI
jgi:prolyl oligopeptidase